jgi:hypothetical protein
MLPARTGGAGESLDKIVRLQTKRSEPRHF